MSVQNLQTLALILLFLTPGALFIYVCALAYSPSTRTQYLREQFPLELTIFFIIVSTVIHSVLVLMSLAIVLTVNTFWPQAHLVEYLVAAISQRTLSDPLNIVFLSILTLMYFWASLCIAYVGGRVLRKRLMRPVPLWQDLLAEVYATAKKENKHCWIQTKLRDSRQVSGHLIDFQCWAENPEAFQLVVTESGENTGEDTAQDKKLVWIDSRQLLEMKLQALEKTTTFIFNAQGPE